MAAHADGAKLSNSERRHRRLSPKLVFTHMAAAAFGLTGGRHLALPPPTRGLHRAGPQRPERQNLPFALVVGHGVLAVGTLALMVATITMLGDA